MAVEAVAACLAGGRRAIVLVPEASPEPATVAQLRAAFGDRVVVFAGGDRRARYRTWLAIRAGAADVVVGTRPAVYAPVRDLGLVFVARESHPGHREERSPMTHVRDVGLARARSAGAVLALAGLCPSAEAAAMRPARGPAAVRRWPKVEVVPPGPEGKARGLVRALPSVTTRVLVQPRARLRDRRGVPVVRRAGRLRGVRRHAPAGGRHAPVRGVRGGRPVPVVRRRDASPSAVAARSGSSSGRARSPQVPVREPGRPRLPRAREDPRRRGGRRPRPGAGRPRAGRRCSRPTSACGGPASPGASARSRPGWRPPRGRGPRAA